MVSADESVLEIALGRGAHGIVEERPSLRSAIHQIEAEAAARQTEALAILHADTPLVTSEALRAALHTLGPVVIAPVRRRARDQPACSDDRPAPSRAGSAPTRSDGTSRRRPSAVCRPRSSSGRSCRSTWTSRAISSPCWRHDARVGRWTSAGTWTSRGGSRHGPDGSERGSGDDQALRRTRAHGNAADRRSDGGGDRRGIPGRFGGPHAADRTTREVRDGAARRRARGTFATARDLGPRTQGTENQGTAVPLSPSCCRGPGTGTPSRG